MYEERKKEKGDSRERERDNRNLMRKGERGKGHHSMKRRSTL